MKTIFLTLALLVASAPLVLAGTETNTADAQAQFKLIHTSDLAPLLEQANPNVHVFDANNKATRKQWGMIPGATALSSHNKYALSVLPSDKDAKLVFYCANEQCMASHAAAKRAVTAGYTDVNVLSDGIMGWKKSGQKTSKTGT